MNGITMRFGATALKRALILGILGAILTGFTVANTVTSTTLGNASIKLASEVFTDDGDVAVAAVGILKVASNTAAAGSSPTGVAMALGLPAVNNTLTKNNFAYRFEVKESSADTLIVGEDLKIEVYGDDGTTTTLLATLYAAGVTADSNIKGVTATVDLGSTTVVHNSFNIVVTRQ